MYKENKPKWKQIKETGKHGLDRKRSFASLFNPNASFPQIIPK